MSPMRLSHAFSIVGETVSVSLLLSGGSEAPEGQETAGGRGLEAGGDNGHLTGGPQCLGQCCQPRSGGGKAFLSLSLL